MINGLEDENLGVLRQSEKTVCAKGTLERGLLALKITSLRSKRVAVLFSVQLFFIVYWFYVYFCAILPPY